MAKIYENERDVLDLIHSFEKASIPRSDWKHPEHLVVAFYYVTHFEIETAIEKMRTGILNLLANGFSVDLTKEMPYHETITIFWIKTVAAFNAVSDGKPLRDKIDQMVTMFDKDYLLKFYSRELLFSDRARAEFVEPDVQLFDSNL
jgi:hypothetical protein